MCIEGVTVIKHQTLAGMGMKHLHKRGQDCKSQTLVKRGYVEHEKNDLLVNSHHVIKIQLLVTSSPRGCCAYRTGIKEKT